ncbi:adenylosuccinate lyase [Patescibacteria group bacterium]
MNKRAELQTLSPLDGRYLAKALPLRKYFSDSALIKHRILIEVLYVLELVSFLKVEKVKSSEKKKLLSWVNNLSLKDFEEVKKIEKEIKHDVKAVEYFIKTALIKLKLQKLSSWVHWGLTSEDTNNLAYGLMIQKAKDKILVPQQKKLIKILLKLADKYKTTSFPGRTHGQVAVPTTFGKEFVVFVSRATFFLEKIINFKLGGKLNGAVGNFNAYIKIFPNKNWLLFSHDFVKKLGLKPVLITTQIEPYSRLCYFLDLQRQLNNVWLDLSQDCWLYISLDLLSQKIKKKEVGSSTMPHKVNPINFENAQGNLELGNSLLQAISNKLPVSRLQRDLSDSTVKRNLGVAFGYSLLAITSLCKGLQKIEPNINLINKEMSMYPEMLTEALQLILKFWGDEKAYSKIKAKIRGKKVSWQEIISSLNKDQQKQLKKWKTKDYIGLAPKLVDLEAKNIKKILKL